MSPASISHPSAPAPESSRGKAPKYLVRKDGVVLHYHPALARLGIFQAAEELPEWHVRGLEEAARREEAARVVLETRRNASAGVGREDDRVAGGMAMQGAGRGEDSEGAVDSRFRGNDGVGKGAASGPALKRRRGRAGAK